VNNALVLFTAALVTVLAIDALIDLVAWLLAWKRGTRGRQ